MTALLSQVHRITHLSHSVTQQADQVHGCNLSFGGCVQPRPSLLDAVGEILCSVGVVLVSNGMAVILIHRATPTVGGARNAHKCSVRDRATTVRVPRSDATNECH